MSRAQFKSGPWPATAGQSGGDRCRDGRGVEARAGDGHVGRWHAGLVRIISGHGVGIADAHHARQHARRAGDGAMNGYDYVGVPCTLNGRPARITGAEPPVRHGP